MRIFLLLPFFLLSFQSLYSDTPMGVVSVSVADLRSSSGSLPTSHKYDPSQETQLLYGETVLITQDQGDWLRVEATEQMEFSHNDLWQGYPGWIRKDAVRISRKIPNSLPIRSLSGWNPNSVSTLECQVWAPAQAVAVRTGSVLGAVLDSSLTGLC